MKKIVLHTLLLLLSLTFLSSCKNGGVKEVLFPVSKDIELGKQLVEEIESNPSEYPVLDSSSYPVAYAHIYRIRDSILKSEDVRYRDEFSWRIRIIKDDDVLNAFAAPGGYIYVYTGIIKFLDTEAELAGVMGHEIAHADRRHSINQMIKNMGVQVLLDVALGDGSETQMTQVLAGLVGLKFSRSDEAEADEYSVIYLCPTTYDAGGAAGFFEKIEAMGGSGTPAFLSTHPDPGNRVEDIHSKQEELGCAGTEEDALYNDFKNSLP